MSFLDSVRCSLSSVFNASCPWHASLFTRKYLPACLPAYSIQFHERYVRCVFPASPLSLRWCLKGSCTQLSSCSMWYSNVENWWCVKSVMFAFFTHSLVDFYSSCTTRATSRLCLGRAGLLHRSGFLKSNSRQTRQGFINVFYFVRHWRLFEFHDLTIFLKFFRSYPK